MGREFSNDKTSLLYTVQGAIGKKGAGGYPSFPLRKNSIKIVGPKTLILALKAL